MKNKLTAGLLGIFLGAFGIHHFYLGNNGRGILYFLLCWTIIVPIIALVEGIIMLTMSDQAFDEKYNNGVSSSHLYGNAAPPANVATQLKELHDLKNQGVITQQEFDEQKKKLLR